MTDPIVNPDTGGINALREQLGTVAMWRNTYAIAKGYMDGRRRAFEVDNADAISSVEDIRAEMASAEMEARGLALMAYAETGSKQPHPGVGIRTVTKLTYSRAAALEWAQGHKMALALDTKAFETYAKAAPDTFPIVTFTQEATATIATDLSKVLNIEPVQR